MKGLVVTVPRPLAQALSAMAARSARSLATALSLGLFVGCDPQLSVAAESGVDLRIPCEFPGVVGGSPQVLLAAAYMRLPCRDRDP